MSHLYAAIAETKHVSLALLKIQRAVLNTVIQFCIPFYETTKQISFDSKLLASCNESSGLFNLQPYIILATNISIPVTENC